MFPYTESQRLSDLRKPRAQEHRFRCPQHCTDQGLYQPCRGSCSGLLKALPGFSPRSRAIPGASWDGKGRRGLQLHSTSRESLTASGVRQPATSLGGRVGTFGNMRLPHQSSGPSLPSKPRCEKLRDRRGSCTTDFFSQMRAL